MNQLVNKTPLISGFTMVKNGLTLGYPIKESIESIAPICDEVIINIGFDDPACTKDDGTYAYLKKYFNHSKFVFIKNYWDPEVATKGVVLSQQTNLALAKCRGKYCQYIQADEVVHELDLQIIHREVMNMEKDDAIHGLIFNYLHFYGNVDIVKHTRSSYRREVRLIRNGLGIKSYLDAQGFRYSDDAKVAAKQIKAKIYHYGWARKEEVMDRKNKSFGKLYHGTTHREAEFIYERVWGLRPFHDTHPELMQEWVEGHRNDLDIMRMDLKWEWRNLGLAFSDTIEFLTGYRMGEFKNFKEIR